MASFSTTPTQIVPSMLFGINPLIKGNVHFIKEDLIIYPAGQTFTVNDLTKKTQTHIAIPWSKKTINLIVMSPNRKYLAVAESGDRPTISIFDLRDRTRIKYLGNPVAGSKAKRFASIAFTFDNKYMVAITGEPDWLLLWYNWERARVETTAKMFDPGDKIGPIFQVSTHPDDHTVIVVVGDCFFKMYSLFGTEFQQYGFERAERVPLTCVTWIAPDKALAGTKDGRFLLIDFGELVGIYRVYDVDEIVIIPRRQRLRLHHHSVTLASNFLEEEQREGTYAVRVLLGFKTGFVYSCDVGVVTVFEKVFKKDKWLKRNVLKVPMPLTGPLSREGLAEIQSICVSPSGTRVAVTTRRATIYIADIMIDQDFDKTPYLWFNIPFSGFHHGPIRCIATCVWKPLFITMGAIDSKITLWNFLTYDVIIEKNMGEEMYSCDIHPSGFFLLIGYSDRIRFYLINIKDFKVVRNLHIRCCPLLKFSEGGHLFAAVNGTDVEVYSAIKFNCIRVFRGHSALVTSALWTRDDMMLSTCCMDGSIYQWDMKTSQRFQDVFKKACAHYDLAASSDPDRLYCVGTDGYVKEIYDQFVQREVDIKQYALYSIAMGHKDTMMFTGGENATIVSVKYPFMHPISSKQYRMHGKAVTIMRLTHDDTRLLTGSKDGTVCVWFVDVPKLTEEDIERAKEFCGYMEDVICDIAYYRSKLTTIVDLKRRIKEMISEHAFFMNSLRVAHEEELKDAREQNIETLERLQFIVEVQDRQSRIDTANFGTAIEIFVHHHDERIDVVEDRYTRRLVYELYRYGHLKDALMELGPKHEAKYNDMVKEYEAKIENLQIECVNAVQKVEKKIAKMGMIIKSEREKFILEKNQIEEDADRELSFIRSEYERTIARQASELIELSKRYKVSSHQVQVQGKEIERLKLLVSNLNMDVSRLKIYKEDLEQEITMHKFTIENQADDLKLKDEGLKEALHNARRYEMESFVTTLRKNIYYKTVEPIQINMIETERRLEKAKDDISDLKHALLKKEFLLSRCKNHVYALKVEIYRQRRVVRRARVVLNYMKKDLHDLSGETYRTKRKLKSAVTKLFHKYVAARERDDFGESAGLIREQLWHREHYERANRTMVSCVKRVYSMRTRAYEQKELIVEATNLQRIIKSKEEALAEYKRLMGCSLNLTTKEYRKLITQSLISQTEGMNKDQEIKELKIIVGLLQEQVGMLKKNAKCGKINVRKTVKKTKKVTWAPGV